MGELSLVSDVSAADWLVAGVRNFEHDVGSLVPAGFASYARVFHPPQYLSEPIRWADVAAANGRTAHPAMEWGALTGSWRSEGQDLIWDEAPAIGSLPRREARALVDVLAPFTATATQCWCAVWDGYASLPADWRSAPRVAMPGRPMFLLRGALAAATTRLEELPAHGDWGPDAFGQSPSLWWPDDHAWCLATDVDLMSSYLGGSQECIDAVVADERLEAAPVSLDQRITWDTDTINPTPPYEL